MWLYSRQEYNHTHYVAVNDRTGKTMRSARVGLWKRLLTGSTLGTAIEGLALTFTEAG